MTSQDILVVSNGWAVYEYKVDEGILSTGAYYSRYKQHFDVVFESILLVDSASLLVTTYD